MDDAHICVVRDVLIPKTMYATIEYIQQNMLKRKEINIAVPEALCGIGPLLWTEAAL